MLNVQNLCSPSSGNKVPNQFDISLKSGSVFQSYSSLIAVWLSDGTKAINTNYYKYSATTSKYNAQFFRCDDAKEMHQMVKDGDIKIVTAKRFEMLVRKAQR